MAQLTKQTWRKGKKRKMHKRQRAWGGQSVAPEGLKAARSETQFGGPRAPRKCGAMKKDGTPCGMIALKGFRVCGAHGAWRGKARQGVHQPSGRTAAYLASMPEEGASVPLELAQMAVYRKASQASRAKLAAAWQTPAFRKMVERVRDG